MTTATRPPQGPTADDKFVATSLQFLAWARNNTRALILGIAAIGLFAAGILYYLDYRQDVQDFASTNLQNLRFELNSGNTSQTIESLRIYIARFGSTRYGTEARVLLAHSLLLQNRAGEAIGPASEAAKNFGSDPLGVRAAFLLAAAQEQVGDTPAAIDVYVRIGNEARLTPERIRGYDAAAQLYAAGGDGARAAQVYGEILALLPEDSPGRAFYEMQAADVSAEAINISG